MCPTKETRSHGNAAYPHSVDVTVAADPADSSGGRRVAVFDEPQPVLELGSLGGGGRTRERLQTLVDLQSIGGHRHWALIQMA